MRPKKGSERGKKNRPAVQRETKSEKCFSVKSELCSPWFYFLHHIKTFANGNRLDSVRAEQEGKREEGGWWWWCWRLSWWWGGGGAAQLRAYHVCLTGPRMFGSPMKAGISSLRERGLSFDYLLYFKQINVHVHEFLIFRAQTLLMLCYNFEVKHHVLLLFYFNDGLRFK